MYQLDSYEFSWEIMAHMILHTYPSCPSNCWGNGKHISRDWCKTIVTCFIRKGCYNSFVLSPQLSMSVPRHLKAFFLWQACGAKMRHTHVIIMLFSSLTMINDGLGKSGKCKKHYFGWFCLLYPRYQHTKQLCDRIYILFAAICLTNNLSGQNKKLISLLQF